MEKIKLNQEQAESYVKEALILIGYPEELNIITYINHEGKPRYEVYYERDSEKHIKPLHRRDIINLIILGMSLNGYAIDSVYIKIKDEEIIYEISTEIVVHEKEYSRNRRRK